MNNRGISEKWYASDLETVFQHLQSGRFGLKSGEINNRLSKFGYNELPEKKKISPIAIFLSQFKNYLVLILIGAAVISAFTGETTNAYVIIFIIVFISVLGFFQEYRAERAMEALKKMVAFEARVLRDGTVKKIPIRELVPGDIIYIEAGDRIPADARLVEAVNLETVESSLTGESHPVSKSTEALNYDMPVAEQKNMVFMGTVIARGNGIAVVTGTGRNAQIGSIAQMIQIKEEEPPLKIRFAKLATQLAKIVLLASLAILITGIMRGQDIFGMLVIASALAVAGIPEALPFIVTATLALGTQRMAKRHAIIRKLPAVETLGCATVICSDKTGTITRGEMTVQKIFTDATIDVTGTGYAPEGEFHRNGGKIEPLLDARLSELLTIGMLCNNSFLESGGGWRIIGDPTEGALLVVAKKANISEHYPRVTELPFDSERRLMSTLHKTPHGIAAFIKGAPEAVLGLCTNIYEGGSARLLKDDDRERIMEANKSMAQEALRVLAFAEKRFEGAGCGKYTSSCVEQDLVFVGLVGMMDPPREEVIGAIATCKSAGVKTVMITGDNKLTATAVGKTIGLLDDGDVLEGNEIEKMSDEELSRAAGSVSIYARASPAHKLRIVDALKRNGHIVAMTGDGVNDAPALKKADIGVAMGITGTDVAREASDMVITDDNFATIVHAIEEGRRIYSNIQKGACYLLSSNFAEVAILFTAVVILDFPIVPLLALQILFVNLVTDEFPALGLTVEPAAKDVMKMPPRDPKENILSKRIVLYTVGITSTIFVGTFALFAWSWNITLDLPLAERTAFAQTTAFATLITFELFNALNSRSLEHSIFRTGLFTNKRLLLALSGSIIAMMLAIYWQPVAAVFKTAPLGLEAWIRILLVSSTVVLTAEIMKKFIRFK
ncbi:MAG: cation-translocating P-type ATPase [Candidatus Methanoperedens sp.]|nr:cation-translocating P-type ATPase [Candidatus Methanoperedens sp.]